MVAEPIAAPAIDLLSTSNEASVRLGLSREELLAVLAEECGWDAIVVRSQTRVDAELLAAAAPRCRSSAWRA